MLFSPGSNDGLGFFDLIALSLLVYREFLNLSMLLTFCINHFMTLMR